MSHTYVSRYWVSSKHLCDVSSLFSDSVYHNILQFYIPYRFWVFCPKRNNSNIDFEIPCILLWLWVLHSCTPSCVLYVQRVVLCFGKEKMFFEDLKASIQNWQHYGSQCRIPGSHYRQKKSPWVFLTGVLWYIRLHIDWIVPFLLSTNVLSTTCPSIFNQTWGSTMSLSGNRTTAYTILDSIFNSVKHSDNTRFSIEHAFVTLNFSCK